MVILDEERTETEISAQEARTDEIPDTRVVVVQPETEPQAQSQSQTESQAQSIQNDSDSDAISIMASDTEI